MKMHHISQDLRLQLKVYSRSLFLWNSEQCNIPEEQIPHLQHRGRLRLPKVNLFVQRVYVLL